MVVVVWLAPELEDDDEPEEPPRELLTVVLMKGVNWAMMFATRSLKVEVYVRFSVVESFLEFQTKLGF